MGAFWYDCTVHHLLQANGTTSLGIFVNLQVGIALYE